MKSILVLFNVSMLFSSVVMADSDDWGLLRGAIVPPALVIAPPAIVLPQVYIGPPPIGYYGAPVPPPYYASGYGYPNPYNVHRGHHHHHRDWD